MSPEQARLYNSYTAQCDRYGGLTEEDIVLPYHLQKGGLVKPDTRGWSTTLASGNDEQVGIEHGQRRSGLTQ